MISLEIEETMVELSLAALEASAGERLGRRIGEGKGGGGEGRGGEGRGRGGVGVGGGGEMELERGRGGRRWMSVAVVGGCSGKVEGRGGGDNDSQ